MSATPIESEVVGSVADEEPIVSEVTADPWPPARQAWYAAAIFGLGLTVNFLDRGIVNLLIEPIKRDLHLSDTQMSLIVGFAFVAFYVLLGLPIARWVDSGPRRLIISLGVALWSVMTAAGGLAANFWQLFTCRVGVGVGEACYGPAFASMLSDFFPKEKLARAIAVVNLGFVAGSSLALIMGGVIIGSVMTMNEVHLPIIGSVRPWQMALFICGIPGLIVAALLLTIKEPKRRGRLPGPQVAQNSQKAMPLADVVHYLRVNRLVYAPIFIGVGLRTVQAFGAQAWMPAFFERTHSWSPQRYGLAAGIIMLVVTPIGMFLGSALSERLHHQGRDDANIRATFLACFLSTPFPILMPLLPTPELALACSGLSTLFSMAALAPENAALQAVTPNQMRGQVSALFLFVFNVIGNGFGPLAVALLTDYVFGADAALRISLVTVAAIAAPASTLLFWIGMKPYGRAYAEARRWN